MTEEKKQNDVSVLIVGTGEYTTGFVAGAASNSDKRCGVVGLVYFDMRSKGFVNEKIVFCGTNGTKFPAIKQHLQRAIQSVYKGISTQCETYPADNVAYDDKAYLKALDSFKSGDVVNIFSPDDSHFEITMAAIDRGLHVMVTKPIVQKIEHHLQIIEAARKKNVLVCVEVHKRYDPMYSDARNRIRQLGDFGYFASYMSQPKHQLDTFRAWAGRSSDISYYLNSHHVDFHCWSLQGLAIPVHVTASASKGICKERIGVDTEDSITLQVQWKMLSSGNIGTAIYTASWVAAPSDVHSQQRFFYQGHKGDVSIDQAHRGYTLSQENSSFASLNPLYMRYTPDEDGCFVGQSGYGYLSFQKFIEAVHKINSKECTAEDWNSKLPTAQATLLVTAILHAGRISLDHDGSRVKIVYENEADPLAPLSLKLVSFNESS